MADLPGNLGQMNVWPGTGNTITFNLNPLNPKCQLIAEGFNLSAVTVSVKYVGDSTEADTVPTTGMNKGCSLADAVNGQAMRSVTIAGMTTGRIGVYQLV